MGNGDNIRDCETITDQLELAVTGAVTGAVTIGAVAVGAVDVAIVALAAEDDGLL